MPPALTQPAISHLPQNGRGRSATLAAMLLIWLGLADSPAAAIAAVADAYGAPTDALFIPSQRRYVGYVMALCEGARSESGGIIIREISMQPVPAMQANTPVLASDEADAATPQLLDIRPYVQVFKDGTMLHSSTWAQDGSPAAEAAADQPASPSKQQHGYSLPPAVPAGSGTSKTWQIDVPLYGDVLLRCRTILPGAARSGGEDARPQARVSTLWRMAIHTDMLPAPVSTGGQTWTVSLPDIDVACNLRAMPADFEVTIKYERVSSSPSAADGIERSAMDVLLSNAADDLVSALAARRLAREEEAAAAAAAAVAASFPTPKPAAAPAPAPAPAPVTPSRPSAATAFDIGSAGKSQTPQWTRDEEALLAEIDELEALEKELGVSSSAALLRSATKTDASATTTPAKSAATPAGSGAVAASPAPAAAAAASEDASAGDASSPAQPAAAAASPGDDDELAEMEAFLESMSK